MNNFIGNNIKFIAEWGQTTIGALIIVLLSLIYLIVRKNRYCLPKGYLGSILFTFLFVGILFSSLIFVRITQIKPGALVIIGELDELLEKKAPKLEYTCLSDQTIRSVDQNQGKVLLVNYWATWCAPCIEEIPDLQAIEAKYGTQGIKVIMISDESPERLLKFVQKREIELEVGYVNAFEWVNLGNERPASFLIDRDGKVVNYITGGRDFEYFEKLILPLLKHR